MQSSEYTLLLREAKLLCFPIEKNVFTKPSACHIKCQSLCQISCDDTTFSTVAATGLYLVCLWLPTVIYHQPCGFCRSQTGTLKEDREGIGSLCSLSLMVPVPEIAPGTQHYFLRTALSRWRIGQRAVYTEMTHSDTRSLRPHAGLRTCACRCRESCLL